MYDAKAPSMIDQVHAFHIKFGDTIGQKFKSGSVNLREMDRRVKFLNEEVTEFTIAAGKLLTSLIQKRDVTHSQPRLAEFLKEYGDVLYVLLGTGVAFGLPVEEILNRVHTSNMTKGGMGPDKKVVKGPGYVAPDLLDLAKECMAPHVV